MEEEPKQTSKQIIETLFKEKETYEQATKDQRDEVNDIYNAYMGRMEAVKNVPYASKETIPKLRTEIAYIKPQIFSGEPEIEVEGIGDEDKALSKILEKIVNHRFKTIPNFYEKVESWVHQSVTFGTSIIRVNWVFETETNEDGTQTPVVDAPDLEIPNILDTYKNPIISEIHEQPCMIFRSVLPVEEVKENPLYDYQDEGYQEPNRMRVGSRGNYQINQYDSSSQVKTDIANAQKATDGLVEIYERITDDRIQTVADGTERVVLRDVENPYGFINAVKLTFEPNAIPNRFDGLGVGQNTLGMGKMYFKMFNQTLTGVTLTNNPGFIFEKGNGIDTRQLVAKPGFGIAVDKDSNRSLRDRIIPIEFPDVKSGAIDILNKMDDEHKRASGANDLLQGSASNATLGQDQLAQSNTSARFELIQRRFKHALSDVADMIIKMELKNLQSPDSEILRIFPMELRQQIYEILISEAQDVKYNVSVRGTTNVARNKNLESKRLVELFQIATSVQTAQGPLLTPEEMRAWIRRIAELQGEQNIDELVAEVPPAPQMPIDPMTGQPMMQGPETMQGMNQEAVNVQ